MFHLKWNDFFKLHFDSINFMEKKNIIIRIGLFSIWSIWWHRCETGVINHLWFANAAKQLTATISLFKFMYKKVENRKLATLAWNPLQCSCLENPRDGGAWWAAVYGVAQSRTQLKRLSSSVKAVSFDLDEKSFTEW